MTALEPPIQHVPNRAPLGSTWLLSDWGLLVSMSCLGSLCSLFGAHREEPSPHLQGVNAVCGFMWFCKFVSSLPKQTDDMWTDSADVGVLALLGFLPFSRGSWWLTGFLNISVHQYLALWREEIRLSVNVKCAELKPTILRVFNYQAIQNLPLLREIFWHHLKVLTSALCRGMKAFDRICLIFHWLFSFAFLQQFYSLQNGSSVSKDS